MVCRGCSWLSFPRRRESSLSREGVDSRLRGNDGVWHGNDGLWCGSDGVWCICYTQISGPFLQLLLQLFLAGQVKLVFTGVDISVFGQRDFNQCFVFSLALHDVEIVCLLRRGNCPDSVWAFCVSNRPDTAWRSECRGRANSLRSVEKKASSGNVSAARRQCCNPTFKLNRPLAQ